MQQPQLLIGPVCIIDVMVRRAGGGCYGMTLTWRHELEEGAPWHRESYDRLDAGELLDVIDVEVTRLLS